MSKTVTKVQYGRERTIQTQVVLWRKRNERFKKLKGLILDRVIAGFNGDSGAAFHWFNTPLPELKGKRPKDYFNPKNIQRLKTVVYKLFKQS